MRTIKRITNFKDGIVVLRTVCEGDASFWLVPMTGQELEKWWEKQDTFNKGSEESKDAEELLCRIFHEPPPLKRKTPIPGEFIHADSAELMDLWDTMDYSSEHYYCLLCCDDSFLKAPDGRNIYHKGYSG